MMVLSELRRIGGRWTAMAAAAAALGGALVACGGGTAQVSAFVPQRMIVLGDESSVIVDDGAHNGKKYSVNGLDSSSVRDCLLQPTWVQSLASHYDMVFAECNAAAATPKGFIRAKVGATVEGATSGLDAQIAEQAASGGAIGSTDIFTVMIGANDLIALADRVQAGTLTAADAVTEARRLGAQVAKRVNALLATGARAIVATVPDMGKSPYALALDKQSAGAAERLSTLTFEFNATLRTGIDPGRFDGRNYGLVLADDVVQAMARYPSIYGLTNVIDGVCRVALPDCTGAAADLVDGGSAGGYLWADATRLAVSAHSQIGTQAVSRATNNPF